MSPVILWVFVSTIGVTLFDLPKPIMLIAQKMMFYNKIDLRLQNKQQFNTQRNERFSIF
jgi:hypothetical protein